VKCPPGRDARRRERGVLRPPVVAFKNGYVVGNPANTGRSGTVRLKRQTVGTPERCVVGSGKRVVGSGQPSHANQTGVVHRRSPTETQVVTPKQCLCSSTVELVAVR